MDRVFEVFFAPRQSLADVRNYFGGYAASDEQFNLGSMDLRKRSRDFALPIMIIQGAEDYDTPVELALAYFDSVSAPQKEFVTLEDAGHTALIYNSGAFLSALNAHARPLAAP